MILERLVDEEGFEVAAIITQPDKPVGRKKVLTPPYLKSFALEKGYTMPIHQPETLRDESVTKLIEGFGADFLVVASYGKIVPDAILELAPPINLHASLLPDHRGASPIHEMLLQGDKMGGVTSMLMSSGLDEGDMLGFRFVSMGQEDDIESLSLKLNTAAAALAVKTLKTFGSLHGIRQFHPLSSYCKKIKKSDGVSDFESSETVLRKYKAYKFWPGISTQEGLKLKEIKMIEDDTLHKKMEILKIGDASVAIGCAQGSIEVSSLQAPGKKEVDAPSYIRGKRMKVGDILA